MRRWMIKTHLFASLLFGLFIVAISLTGSLLVFEKEVEALIHPVPYQATDGKTPLQTIWKNAKDAYPAYQVERITLPDDTGLYQIRLTKQANGKTSTKTVYADPGSGKVFGEALPRSAFYDYTLRLHRYLLLSDLIGRDQANIIVGIIGSGFVIILVTGAVLWWSGIRRWAEGFKIKLTKGKLVLNQSLHKSVGMAITPLLLVLALTGTAYEFDRYVFDWLGISRTVQAPADKIEVVPSGGSLLPVDKIVEQALQANPGAELIRITMPSKPSQAVQIAMKDGYTPNGNSNTTVYIDPYSGQVLWKTDPGAAVTLYQSWKSGLHFGRWGGLPVKILYFFIGIMPFMLMVTGIAIWRLKARVRSRSKVNRERREEAVLLR